MLETIEIISLDNSLINPNICGGSINYFILSRLHIMLFLMKLFSQSKSKVLQCHLHLNIALLVLKNFLNFRDKIIRVLSEIGYHNH